LSQRAAIDHGFGRLRDQAARRRGAGLMPSPDSAAPGESRVVALVGAGRGGTTLLYKLLSLHRDVAFLSNYQARAPRWPVLALTQRAVRDRHELKRQTWFKADGSAYFSGARRRLHALVPAPSESEAVYASCGIPLEPPATLKPDAAACAALARRFGEVLHHAGARVLLTKRTSNNRRIGWLESALPGIRYINLLRDGRAVARSLLKVEWWSEHELFWAGKSPTQLVAEGHDELELAARNWVEEVVGIERALAAVAPERIRTLRYEDLVSDPEGALTGLLKFMGIEPDSDPFFLATVSRLGLKPTGLPCDPHWTPGQRAMVEHFQGALLRTLGYTL
jgi:Sulfotransferase family